MEMTRLFRHHWACQTLFWLLSDKVQGGQRQISWWSDVMLKSPLILIDFLSVFLSENTLFESKWLQRPEKKNSSDHRQQKSFLQTIICKSSILSHPNVVAN